MVTALLVAACVLAVLVRNKKRARDRQRQPKGFSDSCLKISLEFLVPFICVTFFYHLVLLTAWVASQFAGIQSLIQFEDALDKIKAAIALIELNPVETVLALFALYLLGLFRAFARASEKLRRWLDLYQTALRRIYIVIVLLCSFTLFGKELGPPSNHLKLRVKTVREGYAEVCRKIESALAEEIADQLYAQALDSLPKPYQQALAEADTVYSLVRTVREHYTEAQKQHGFKIPPIQILLDSYAAKEKKVEAAEQAFRNMDESAKRGPARGSSIPPQTSYRDLEQAKTALDEHQKKFGTRGIRFLQRNGAKQLISQLAQILTTRLKESMRSFMRPLLASTQLSEVLTEAIFGTIDDYSQTKIEEAIDNATKTVAENPRALAKTLESEAKKVVNSTPVKVTKGALEKANREIKRWQADFEKIRKANALIAQEVQRAESARIDKLISRLNSSNEQTRLEAVRELSKQGNKLSQKQFNRLVGLMRNGEASWSNYLSRESHCTWYEEVSVKQYAAEALRQMNSPHVNEAISSEARAAASQGKRRYKVTDPGWI